MENLSDHTQERCPHGCPKCAADYLDMSELRNRLEAAERNVKHHADGWRIESELRYDAEARVARLTARLERALYLANHLWLMIPQKVWRDSGGDDGQGHYEGDYRAEQVRDELAALAASPGEPGQERSRGTHVDYRAALVQISCEIDQYGEWTPAAQTILTEALEARLGGANEPGELTTSQAEEEALDDVPSSKPEAQEPRLESLEARLNAVIEQRDGAFDALRAWMRFARHLESRQHRVPLWAALLNDEAITLTEAALPVEEPNDCP